MTNAAQCAEELQSQMNHIMANSHPDRAINPTEAWSHVCFLEAEMVACQQEAKTIRDWTQMTA